MKRTWGTQDCQRKHKIQAEIQNKIRTTPQKMGFTVGDVTSLQLILEDDDDEIYIRISNQYEQLLYSLL